MSAPRTASTDGADNRKSDQHLCEETVYIVAGGLVLVGA